MKIATYFVTSWPLISIFLSVLGYFQIIKNMQTYLLSLKLWILFKNLIIVLWAFLKDWYWIQNYQYIKNTSTQNCILFLLEKWRKCVDNKGSPGIVNWFIKSLTALSMISYRVLNDFSHFSGLLILMNPVIAKLNAYGFDYSPMKLIYNYLTDRLQWVKVNSWSKIIYRGYHKGPF